MKLARLRLFSPTVVRFGKSVVGRHSRCDRTPVAAPRLEASGDEGQLDRLTLDASLGEVGA